MWSGSGVGQFLGHFVHQEPKTSGGIPHCFATWWVGRGSFQAPDLEFARWQKPTHRLQFQVYLNWIVVIICEKNHRDPIISEETCLAIRKGNWNKQLLWRGTSTTCPVAEVQGGMRHTNKSMEDRERRRFLDWPIATRILHLGKRRILAPKP